MGSQTSTQQSSIPGRTGAENEIEQMLRAFIEQAQGQMGDLSDLASGNLQASGQDRAFLQESIGAGRDIAERQARRSYEDASRMTEEDLLGRGMDQSTIDAVTQALQGRQYQDTMDNIGSQAQGQMATGMMQLPFQRAQTQLNANQLLLQRLMGGAQTIMGHNLQERMGQQTVTSQQPQDWAALAGQGAQLAVDLKTGGLSRAAREAAARSNAYAGRV